MKKKVKNKRHFALTKGKIKSISLWETLLLINAGRKDGRRELPREGSYGWSSPFLEQETRAYDEFASRQWGDLQLEQEADFAMLGKLIDSVTHVKVELDEATVSLEKAVEREKSVDTSRGPGESRLTEAQVKARRAKEKEKRLSVYKNRVSTLQNRLVTDVEQFIDLHNKLEEDNNSIRLICNRVKDHVQQRLCVYWNAVMRTHPDEASMPVIPPIELSHRSEDFYKQTHERLMTQAQRLRRTLVAENDKEVL